MASLRTEHARQRRSRRARVVGSMEPSGSGWMKRAVPKCASKPKLPTKAVNLCVKGRGRVSTRRVCNTFKTVGRMSGAALYPDLDKVRFLKPERVRLFGNSEHCFDWERHLDLLVRDHGVRIAVVAVAQRAHQAAQVLGVPWRPADDDPPCSSCQ